MLTGEFWKGSPHVKWGLRNMVLLKRNRKLFYGGRDGSCMVGMLTIFSSSWSSSFLYSSSRTLFLFSWTQLLGNVSWLYNVKLGCDLGDALVNSLVRARIHYYYSISDTFSSSLCVKLRRRVHHFLRQSVIAEQLLYLFQISEWNCFLPIYTRCVLSSETTMKNSTLSSTW